MLTYGRRPEPPPHDDWWKTAWDPDSADRIWECVNEPEHLDSHIDALIQWLQVEPGQTVLDVGCGNGRTTVAMARRGLRMIGLDYSAAQLHRARQRAHEANVSCEWVKGDMRECALRAPVDAAFLTVGTFGGLANRSEHAKALQAVARVIKPGGRLYVENLNRESVPYDRFVGVMKKEPGFELSVGLSMDYWLDRANFQLILKREEAYPEMLEMDLQLFTLFDYVEFAEAAGMSVVQATGGLGRTKRPYVPEETFLVGAVMVKKDPNKGQRPAVATAAKAAPPRRA